MTSKALPGWVDYALLLLLAAFWGASFSLIKQTVGDYPPAFMSMLRLAIAGGAMLCVALWLGERIAWSRQTAVMLLLIGIFGNSLPFSLIAWGQQVVDAGLASILMGIMPIATLIMAHYFTGDEPLSARKITGAIVGLAGLVILVGPSVLYRLGDDGIRQLAIVGAAISYGINAILTKSMLHQPRRAAAAALLIAGALTLVPLSLFTENWNAITPGVTSTASIVLLALFPTALASLLVFIVLERQGAGFFSQINFLVPLFGVLWAVTLLGETLQPQALLALGVILTGLVIARPPAQRKTRTA
ncbi:DMT family transporter [Zhengella sp. ZM62]|uniref:DMT family transporter n=1 Tax=Zhengella sedimenti TaxID=3390035 RepID=UPI00397691A0